MLLLSDRIFQGDELSKSIELGTMEIFPNTAREASAGRVMLSHSSQGSIFSAWNYVCRYARR